MIIFLVHKTYKVISWLRAKLIAWTTLSPVYCLQYIGRFAWTTKKIGEIFFIMFSMENTSYWLSWVMCRAVTRFLTLHGESIRDSYISRILKKWVLMTWNHPNANDPLINHYDVRTNLNIHGGPLFQDYWS